MNIEELTKSQIVLLVLLVSFVTSMATGIVTVSLMDQAPPVIPQTINRVVERTVERVVPEETQVATVITQEKTVVVKESDLITQAIARIRPSVIRVHLAGEDELGEFLARGVVVAPGYAIAHVPPTYTDEVLTLVSTVGNYAVSVETIDETTGLAVLAINAEEEQPAIAAASMNTGAVTLGQTIVGATGSASLKVATGIATGITEGENEDGEPYQASFATDISSPVLVPGSVLANTDGAIIGMFVGDNDAIVPSSVLLELLKELEAAASSEEASENQEEVAPTAAN